MTARRKSVLAATRGELDRLGKIQSPLGSVALTLAARLDRGDDPGSAVAAMAKELRAVLIELGRAAPAVADPVDELKRRRRERQAGG